MQDRWEPGRLVVSTAGRDRGKFYLVLRKDPDNKVSIVDGETRRVSNPKRKNEKHLRACPEMSADINQKVKSGLKVTDVDVQRALKEIITNYTANGG
ncbi:MAG: KOW domain-containing RNA-binding protein [Peptococcaceae bacterium]|nr:KOW domain-containing RNA-binding protein [Peptococcaceae bacterium]